MKNGEEKKLEIMVGTLNGNKARFSTNNSIIVAFNPTEYSLEKTNGFSESAIPGLDAPIIQFGSGKARTLSLELLIDTYAYDNGEDIRKKYIERIEQLIKVDGNLHAPPPCKVVWGSLEFIGVLESLSKKHTMFLGDGTPVRARLSLKFKEYIPVDVQLKATKRASPDKRKEYVLKEGDSLWQLAHQAYGDARLWRVLAEANGLDDPRQVPIGKVLVVPALTWKGREAISHA